MTRSLQHPRTSRLPADAGSWLLPVARASIARHLGAPVAPPAAPRWAMAEGACFVTLRVRDNDSLRGCIGSLRAWRPLADDVTANAVAAATRDPRFDAVTRPELDRLNVEVSVLSSPDPLAFDDQADLRRRLRPGVDGLILTWHGHRGTFLPQVWEELPDPARFLDQLKRKAGLPSDWWADDAVLERYTVTAWKEP
ncbi:MAG: AmmeMemoRadiSam system protein A [Acidipropionibacterium acidipropionici]|jgi:AmmeMemoRadiSam system protein A|uniref:AMMECR1 domain-containing protein n=2 Tax=Acidipropionibacterium acidipropionici TaxID=1748 RepID=A0AAC9FBY3_9ACTN|nr:AmmeMemoRadiSam system protein A [Acidipropionibacterium acidipropionici]AFV90275.1 AMMECR1 protein [Acidipropionibacterium acidipropionici ATCC 4875]AMS05023.1 hypothetical protein AXH35_05630 [Acidipropionibacterium acidipropionici]AOZ46503.1 hypothetical protein A8L58_07095 [Acidipropionibacterium acidipropionici]AZP37447.1 AmmeMemoRadiSam system protein A [Acidipropionibacterium acidipropionici]